MSIITLFSGILKATVGFFVEYIAVILPLLTGIYFTLHTRFVQVRCFFEGVRLLFQKEKSVGISPLAALSAAIGSAVGVGNVVGAAAAIVIGGAGAVLWMWIAAFFGMAVVYSEAKTALETREETKGGFSGGPALYIEKTFRGGGGRFLSAVFSLSAVLALGFSGGALQSSVVCSTVSASFRISPLLISVSLAFFTLIAVTGGVARVSKICEKTVLLISLLFLATLLLVIIKNIEFLPICFKMIFKSAFNIRSVSGGGAAAMFITVGQGVKKGIYSNEAGLGTSPHIHAATSYPSPHKAGVVAMQSVFVDSFVILSATSLAMLSVAVASGVTDFSAENPDMMMQNALASVFGEGTAAAIIAVSLILFGYSSIISWNYIGSLNARRLFGEKSLVPYFIISTVFVGLGGVIESGFLWYLSDFLNVFMILPNCMALILYKKRKTLRQNA